MRWAATTVASLCLAVAAGLAYLWLEPETGEPRSFGWERPGVVKPELPAVGQSPDSMLPVTDPANYLAMLERPLFAVDRRPPPPPKVVVAPPPDPLNNLQLLGVFSGEFSGIIARVDGKTRRIKVTDKVGDWTLSAVDQREAAFARGEEKRTIKLAYGRWGSAPAATLAAAPSRPASPSNIPPPMSEDERARKQQEAEAERWRAVNEIRARAGMLRP